MATHPLCVELTEEEGASIQGGLGFAMNVPIYGDGKTDGFISFSIPSKSSVGEISFLIPGLGLPPLSFPVPLNGLEKSLALLGSLLG